MKHLFRGTLYNKWKCMKHAVLLAKRFQKKISYLLKRSSFTHQMAVPVPSINCCVLNHHNLFYHIQNALVFNWDMCWHLAVASFPLPAVASWEIVNFKIASLSKIAKPSWHVKRALNWPSTSFKGFCTIQYRQNDAATITTFKLTNQANSKVNSPS